MNVRIHIDRVVLDGITLDAADQRRFRAAMEHELGTLLRIGGLSGEVHAASALAAVRTTPISIADGTSAATVGRSVAASVYRGIGGGR